ncbi:ABC transporter permease [Conexibacter woesei]|uniref:Binding-protein-dependent transport systems inner membrane component n=1 Tax=Conexibacter woesei (strain DSM 14684 / CCUG 47730 / CIP 108061 / JCM 11494 / NBRC 100937 / ID131577) TaxID=469383 RepID=D3F4G0_CONWI|nr:ABC transporter permease [Conexibacter woesei]ADB50532.1 binding-protein-dependent transport systems inner membrane component [Conexibacter woesei DSM 14684]
MRRRGGSAIRAVLRAPEGRIGAALALLVLAIVVLGPALAPYPPEKLGVGAPSAGPSAEHLLGTDTLGRDVLSRVLCGGASVIVIPLIAVLLAQLVGGGLGLAAGYLGGRWDAILTRLFDVVMTLPPLLLVLVLIAGLGSSAPVLAVVVALVFLPRAGRIARAATRSVAGADYVVAARLRGESAGYVVGREILPNIAGPLMADAALRLTYAIIFVATLNFLGLGVQPPRPDWAVMISEGRATIAVTPLGVLAPAVAIAALSVSANLIADALTAHWSPDVRRAGVH